MNDGYLELANAIVLQAVSDYRSALRRLHIRPDDSAVLHEVRKIEHFFSSEYFKVLTKIDHKMLIKRLRAEVRVGTEAENI